MRSQSKKWFPTQYSNSGFPTLSWLGEHFHAQRSFIILAPHVPSSVLQLFHNYRAASTQLSWSIISFNFRMAAGGSSRFPISSLWSPEDKAGLSRSTLREQLSLESDSGLSEPKFSDLPSRPGASRFLKSFTVFELSSCTCLLCRNWSDHKVNDKKSLMIHHPKNNLCY